MNNENHNTEYKRIWKDEYLKWICGFANANGGKIYVGIDNDMSAIGISHLHQHLEDIPNKIVSMLGIVPMVTHIKHDNKDVIEIDIEPSTVPISYKGIFYIRSGATNQELRGVALQQFLMKKFGRNWEDLPCYGTTIDDIDPDAIRYFLKKSIIEGRMSLDAESSTPEEVISNLGLMEDGTPCNGAILLFGKHPQRRFVTSSFKIGRFGTSNFDLLNQEIIYGNLIQMPDQVIRTLSDKYLIRPIHYDGLQRVEPLEIPEEALREMICNAIVHRDYQGTWTQMSIYDDHIRLWNDGELPNDLSIEKLMGKHTSKPRNPKMAEAFYRAGLIEAWGRGIEKIINGFKTEGLTPPDISVEQGGISIYIPREKFEAIKLEGTSAHKPHIGDRKPTSNHIDNAKTGSEKGSEKSSEKSSEKTRDRIIIEIQENPNITINHLASLLSISDRAVSKHLKKLQEQGIIRRVGADRGGHWCVVNSGDQ